MEDYVYVLDYLAKGRGDLPAFKRNPVVYGIGESQYTFLELIPKRDATFTTGERIYVGKDPTLRTKIEKIKGRVNFEDLTSTAHGELPYVLLDIVHNNEAHVLELLPGLGKKMMIEILDERKKKPFTTFKEMQDRIDFLRSPDKLISKRIELELTDPTQKYRVFTRLPLSRDHQI
jgi:putative nucleotide binding protein